MPIDAPSAEQRTSTTPAIVVAGASGVGAILLATAAASAEENTGVFWFGISAVLCGALSVVLVVAVIAVHKASRSLLTTRRVAALTFAMFLIALVGVVLGGQGADSWCTNEGFRRSPSLDHQALSLSAWPPGVQCTLNYDGERSEVYWPINW